MVCKLDVTCGISYYVVDTGILGIDSFYCFVQESRKSYVGNLDVAASS